MYSNLKSVQFLIAGLKKYNINKVVISPGNSHNAIVRSIEEDSFFKTYSVVDERSAAFFACGVSQQTKDPVAICCTAGTAASNYLTGVTEASRRGLPIVVITGDKHPYYLEQYEDQMIETMSIFENVVKYSCKLPIGDSVKDQWYCQRVINEALLELDHHGTGPVHIDVPIEAGMMAIGDYFTTVKLPEFHKINRFNLFDKNKLSGVFKSLKRKRVFIICGQDDHIPQKEIDLIESISKKYNCVFGVDKLSNLHCRGTIETTRVAKAYQYKIREILPDIVISIAGNPCMDFKFVLKCYSEKFDHWIVNSNGKVADPFKKLNTVFEGSTIQFLEAMNEYGEENTDNNYLKKWVDWSKQVSLPKIEYSNLYTVKLLMEKMSKNSIFNIANSTTIRIAQYFDIDDSIQVYCNRGVNGIDGCVSTFIGQAEASKNTLNYLIVGDLTFFYDMNSIWNRYVGNNVRIMLNNNEGASLFHFNQGTKNYPSLNENVAAEHFATAKGWVESQGFKYISATNKVEFDKALNDFMSDSDKPIFFEVFTHKDEDARVQHEFYEKMVKFDALGKTKNIIGSIIGQNAINIIKGRKE